jgi:hypothetical protein
MTEESGKQDYFTTEELKSIGKSMGAISSVGFSITSYQTSYPQMKAFFNKAKLWRVIKTIIQELYITRLASGKMFLKDMDGNEYRVVMKKKGE